MAALINTDWSYLVDLLHRYQNLGPFLDIIPYSKGISDLSIRGLGAATEKTYPKFETAVVLALRIAPPWPHVQETFYMIYEISINSKNRNCTAPDRT